MAGKKAYVEDTSKPDVRVLAAVEEIYTSETDTSKYIRPKGSNELEFVTGRVFGSEYQQQETAWPTPVSETGTSYQIKSTLTTTSLPSGTYRIEWCYDTSNNSATSVEARIYNNTTSTEYEASSHTGAQYRNYNGSYVASLSGVNVIYMQLKLTGSGTVYAKYIRLELWRTS